MSSTSRTWSARELELVKCGIQMYYELGVVRKFQIPQEVRAHLDPGSQLSQEVREMVPSQFLVGSSASRVHTEWTVQAGQRHTRQVCGD